MATRKQNEKQFDSWTELNNGGRLYKKVVSGKHGLIMNGFEANAAESELIHRLGVADAENFDLSWEELSQMLKQLGYKVHLELQVA
jgi:hypothetical protein